MVFLTMMRKIGILETTIPKMKVATIYFLPAKVPQKTSTNQTTSPSSVRTEQRTTIDEAPQFWE